MLMVGNKNPHHMVNYPQKVRQLSGDTFMRKRISVEIRQKVLELLRQGARARSISSQLGITRSTVKNWQAAYDQHDLSWVTVTGYYRTSEATALLAVSMYQETNSYARVGHALGLNPASVLRYVTNMAKYGQPILPRGQKPKEPVMKAEKNDIQVPEPMPTTLKAAQRLIKEQRIMLESLLESIDEHLGGTVGSKKKISVLSRQLRKHMKEGYPLPNLADLSIPPGAPITVVLEVLARECAQIRSSVIASKLCVSSTKDATGSSE